MKIILLQELKGKGGEGDIVEVSRGFAVNYLFKSGIAVEATTGNLKQLELRKHNIEKREAGRVDTAEKMFKALNGKSVVVVAKVGAEGQLFGSITAQVIADAIQEQLGIEINRKKIYIHKTIKTAGQHEVDILIYRDVKATLILNVGDTYEKLVESVSTEDVVEEIVEEIVVEEIIVEEVSE